jgi:hypothetical protein
MTKYFIEQFASDIEYQRRQDENSDPISYPNQPRHNELLPAVQHILEISLLACTVFWFSGQH